MQYGLDRVKRGKRKGLYSCVLMSDKIFEIILPDHRENIEKKIKKSYTQSKKADNFARRVNSWIQYGLTFEHPYALRGTSFEKKVYKKVTEIPPGKVASYKQVAESLGSRAYRAVGNAMKKNPIPLLVPCHRVINTNRELGGYGGGLDLKKRILFKEGVEVENDRVPGRYFVETL